MLRALFAELAAHGSVLMVVDQPRNIGALPIAVARDSAIDVAYLPGLRMRRIAALYPGQAKTDARDAFIIADAARTLPDTLYPSPKTTTSSKACECSPDSTRTWPPRRTASRAASDRYCSRCTPPSNGPSANTCTAPSPWHCWPSSVARSGSPQQPRRHCDGSRNGRHRPSATRSRTRLSLHWPSRPCSCRGRRNRTSC
ncbi:hypothetical protein CH275_09905 [Rhodococcus sp. 06-235-1A]|nr:hypothetical protein CH275_09905 [Rhodococcus sp. 06-235-1A]